MLVKVLCWLCGRRIEGPKSSEYIVYDGCCGCTDRESADDLWELWQDEGGEG